MCKCRYTTWELLDTLNQKRVRAGLDPMPYVVFLMRYRVVADFIPPDEVVGRSYIFRKGTMSRIVKALWKNKYRSVPRVDWMSHNKVA
jgi:hypothetical protein